MPADPATQFQQAGLSIPYQFQPTVTQLGGSHLFGGAGEILAGAGKTALAGAAQLFQTLKESPLNPLVKAKMDAGIKAAQQGMDITDWANQQGQAGKMLFGVTPEGTAAMTSGAAASQLNPMVGTSLLANEPGKPQVNQPHRGNDPSETPVTPPVPAPAPAPGPTGTFVNPATGNVEPLQTTPPGAQPTPQAQPQPNQPPKYPQDLLRPTASMFGRPGGQPPAAPDFSGQLAQFNVPSRGGTTAGLSASTEPAADQKAQQDLANWQNTTQTEPLTADDAMKWIRRQTTKAKHATYMPHGGPNNSPAFAFDMDGGGSNIIPVTQMVQNGAGPSVAAQNTSVVLSQSDKIKQQQQAAQAAVQGAPPQQVAPTIASDQGGLQGAPPLAPTIASDQGGVQGAPPAPSTAYDPTAYRQAIAQATADRRNLTAQTGPATPPAQPAAQTPPPAISDADFHANVKPLPSDQVPKGEEATDPFVKNFGGFDWYQDRHDGRLYATMKSPTSTLNQQRFYWGSKGWEDMPMENSQLRQELRNVRANTPGINVSDEETTSLPIPQVKSMLNIAKLYHATGGDPTGTTTLNIRGLANQSKSYQRLIDMIQAAKDAKIDPSEYSSTAEDRSVNAAKSASWDPHGIGPLFTGPKEWGPLSGPQGFNPADAFRQGMSEWHKMWARGEPIHPLVDSMTQETKYLTGQMQQTPGLQYSPEGKPENSGIPISVGGYGAGATTRIPLPGELSPLQEVNRLFQSQNQDVVLAGLKKLKERNDQDLQDSLGIAGGLNYRIPTQFIQAGESLAKGENIADSENTFRDKNGTLRMPAGMAPPKATPGPTATPSPTATPGPSPTPQLPTVKTQDLDKFIQTHDPGTVFLDENGNTVRIKPKKR